jgi:chromodomain-helicase-DNA-binding protein 4
LAGPQRDEILKAAREVDRYNQSLVLGGDGQGSHTEAQQYKHGDAEKRMTLLASETTEFICAACMKGAACMGCKEVALEPDAIIQSKTAAGKESSGTIAEQSSGQNKNQDIEMTDGIFQPASDSSKELAVRKSLRELFFRCVTCKRLAHYRCLPHPPSFSGAIDLAVYAEHYQSTTNWLCADCFSYTYGLDKIIAWRPDPPNATEASRAPDEPVNWKYLLPREYLVKWADRSYRRVQWVPHMWLVSTHPQKLKKFLEEGPKIELLAEAVSRDTMDVDRVSTPTFEIGEDEPGDSGDSGDSTKVEAKTPARPSDPLPDAEFRIPSAWKTVNRVLDVLLWYPEKRKEQKARPKKQNKNRRRSGKGKRSIVVDSDLEESSELTDNDQDEEMSSKMEEEHATIFEDGEQPPEDLTETLEEFEARTRKELRMQDIDHVVWAFMKWEDLGYEEGRLNLMLVLQQADPWKFA